MILLIDNYDSFVYNLARYINELGQHCIVKRNDNITTDEIVRMPVSHIIISPGPGGPQQAGASLEIVDKFKAKLPILGVCLGHQVIGAAFGAKIMRADYPCHGKASLVYHQQEALFAEVPSPFFAGRYHSLIVSHENFPDDLLITAKNAEDQIMGLQHRHWPIFGVQFHPESILTQYGHDILRNFLKLTG